MNIFLNLCNLLIAHVQLINCIHPGTLPVDLACFLHQNTHILCRCDIKRKYHLCSRRINEKYRLYLMKMNEYHSCYALVVLIQFHQIRAVFFINSSRTVVFPILTLLILVLLPLLLLSSLGIMDYIIFLMPDS